MASTAAATSRSSSRKGKEKEEVPKSPSVKAPAVPKNVFSAFGEDSEESDSDED